MSPLAGRTIVVTRPREQAGPLCEGVAAAGGTAVAFPLIEIEALPDDPACQFALTRLDEATLAIFISPNAVAFGVPRVLGYRPWPLELTLAAVGQGTANALRKMGFKQVVVPAAGFDSEALLACPELSATALKGKTVLLFKGEGGRDLLASTLAERGAEVLPAPCYRRLPPVGDVAELLALHEAGQLSGIVVSSSEAVRHLGCLLPKAQRRLLESTVFFCSHPRIAEAARVIGCQQICLTRPGDAGILAGLSEYNWPS